MLRRYLPTVVKANGEGLEAKGEGLEANVEIVVADNGSSDNSVWVGK